MSSANIAVIAILCAFLGFLPTTKAAEIATATATQSQPADPWTPEDMVFVDTAEQFRISPDGNWAAWVKQVPDRKTDSRAGHLMLSNLKTSEEVELTRWEDTIAQPRWAPDGKLIAFLSTRPRPSDNSGDKASHIWLINPFGGEPWPASSSNLQVKHFEWVDSNTIAFSAKEDASRYESRTKRERDDSVVVDDDEHETPVRLFRLSLKNGNVARITNNDRWIDTFEISPDGKRAVVMENRELSYQWDRKVAPAIFIVDLANGKEQQIFTKNDLYPRIVRWAADGSGIYAIVPYSSLFVQPSGFVRLVYFYDLASGTAEKVNLDWEKGVGFLQRMDITPNGFMVLLADGVRFKLARYTRHGSTWSHEWVQGKHEKNYFDFVLSPGARSLVYEYSTASTPSKWYRAKLNGAHIEDAVTLVDVYPQLRQKLAAKTEVIHWKGANDDQIDGILYYPDQYLAGKRYPLITYTHGGPMGADLDAWSANPAYIANLMTQRGAFVLSTNYHGSANYGEKWAESICCGKYYELEIPDIEKGVDHLIAQGLVDPERIGAFGWSNGAILSIELEVVDPGRYKAVVVGAGDVDYVSDWGNSNAGYAFDKFYFGKSLFEDPALFINKSPLYRMDHVRSPTLIMQGSADDTVPTEQGWLLYRALYYLHKAPVRFVLFPGEGHFPLKLSHQLRVASEELAWFDKYLFDTEHLTDDSLEPGSPLAAALQHPIHRVGSRYGVEILPPVSSRKSGWRILIPETVVYKSLQVGRFEVTRAQFAEFDKQYKYNPGAENYPASGITYGQAKAYCVWLTNVTGQTYRLPDEHEAEVLYQNHPGENTLDYWAGYAVNPDDAKRLEKLLTRIHPDVLLKTVGSFPGVEDQGQQQLVYDLGGNVSEWVQTLDGKGKLFGGSADRPADPKSQVQTSDSAFAGFRIIRGERQPTSNK